jgi:hypothetical protein
MPSSGLDPMSRWDGRALAQHCAEDAHLVVDGGGAGSLERVPAAVKDSAGVLLPGRLGERAQRVGQAADQPLQHPLAPGAGADVRLGGPGLGRGEFVTEQFPKRLRVRARDQGRRRLAEHGRTPAAAFV